MKRGAANLDWFVNVATWIVVLLVLVAAVVGIVNWVGKA